MFLIKPSPLSNRSVEIFVSPAKGFYLLVRLKSLKVFRKRIDSRIRNDIFSHPTPLLIYRVSGGLFWCYRKDFEMLRGFNETLVSAEDVDFARRLKSCGKSKGKRFKTITKAHIVTSCRKFDEFGDWFLFKNPRLVWKIFQGKDQKAADRL